MNKMMNFIFGCFFIVSLLFASEQESKINERLVAIEEVKNHTLRKRQYHINMLKQYAICLENSKSDEGQQFCMNEYATALNYLHHEESKVLAFAQKSKLAVDDSIKNKTK